MGEGRVRALFSPPFQRSALTLTPGGGPVVGASTIIRLSPKLAPGAVMDQSSQEFLKALLNAPSPSGYERPIQDVVRKFVEPFAASVTTDWHGNVIAAVNPDGRPRIMLAGHCDQIGLMVKHIDDKGFVRVTAIGGWDMQMLLGQKLHVWTAKGPVVGVIARKPIHLLPQEERKSVPEIKDL